MIVPHMTIVCEAWETLRIVRKREVFFVQNSKIRSKEIRARPSTVNPSRSTKMLTYSWSMGTYEG